MTTRFQNWKALWEETIKYSSLEYRGDGRSEMDRINISAELWHRNYYRKHNLDDLQMGPDLEEELNRLKRFVTRDSSVLDIGAGYGRLTIPLAKEIRKMTAIEPAKAYMKFMKNRASKESISNIDFVEDLWSDFQTGELFDLVYSTWSWAIMSPAALMKMHESSCGYCALELEASPPKVWDFASCQWRSKSVQ